MTKLPEPTRILGLPIGDFGLVQSVLLAVATGFLTFFAMTFLSIIGVSIYKGLTHSAVTLAVSYKYIAFPTALIVLAAALVFLLTVWAKRKFRAA